MIVACAILHNIAKSRGLPEIEDHHEQHEEEDHGNEDLHNVGNGFLVRDAIVQAFFAV